MPVSTSKIALMGGIGFGVTFGCPPGGVTPDSRIIVGDSMR